MTLSWEVPLLLETCSVFWIKNKLILQTIFQSSFDIVLLSSLQFLICIYNYFLYIYIMLFNPTIARKYFVKTQTWVASFGPPDLSVIFMSGISLEVSPL